MMELFAGLVNNSNYLVFFIASISVVIYIFILSSSSKRENTVPEAGGSWPLLGHLPLLARSGRPAHIVLGDLADRWGAIFTLRLGVHRTIIVSSWEIAKECLTTHDRNFANRPKVMSMEVLGYNRAMFAFSPYGPYWRRLRKVATHQLLSAHRLELLKHVRESEVNASIKDTYRRWSQTAASSSTMMVDMNIWFGDIMLNIIFRMILGKRFHDDDQVDEKERKALEEFPRMVGQSVVSDLIPALRWLDIGGHEKAMRRTAEELDVLMQRWLVEHKAVKQQQAAAGSETKDQDFMDVILSTLGDDEQVHDDGGDGDSTTYDSDTVNKATCLVMLLAGADTTAATLLWGLSLLLNHKESLYKVQQELDSVVGKDRQVKESDIKNLPYFQAVIKETLRLYPAGPLAVPHEAEQDCTVRGYHVRKGTRLMLNLYKIQRDPRVWTDPDAYNPDRFLSGDHKDWDVIGRNFEFIPFGSGRRMCPGVSLALRLVELSLASLLHCFQVNSPGDEPVDMTEAAAMTNVKATTLQALFTPRLNHSMYV